MSGHIILSHGLNSRPQATKVSALARMAETMGYTTERPDFSGYDALGHTACIAPRVEHLQARMQAAAKPPILVGSSMGAYTSALASAGCPCASLFLLALPVHIPGAEQRLVKTAVPTMLIHGFDDAVCPVDDAMMIAREWKAPCLLVADGHRLSGHVDMIATQFRLFLERML